MMEFSCPVEATVHLIGGKYKSVILWHLKDQTLRYSALHRLVPRATPKMLTEQLRALEADGLTEFGRTIIPVLDAMCAWGGAYLGGAQPCCGKAGPEAAR